MKRLLMTGLLIFGAISSGKAAMAKKIDKEALASKIKALAGLDAEERSELLGLLSERKKYGLVWEQHEEAVDVQMRTQIPVFTEDADREITAIPGGAYNFLLEGDNLHSLRLLEKTHKGRIDVIYIDIKTPRLIQFNYSSADFAACRVIFVLQGNLCRQQHKLHTMG